MILWDQVSKTIWFDQLHKSLIIKELRDAGGRRPASRWLTGTYAILPDCRFDLFSTLLVYLNVLFEIFQGFKPG